MDVCVGTVKNETNTFSPGTTTIDDFEFVTGEPLFGSFAADLSIKGIHEELRATDIDLHPTVGANAISSPLIDASTFEHIRSELLARIEDVSPDGVCLDLHGSMYAEGHPDPEGEILSDIRNIVGPDVPITVALDMHATVTEMFVEHVDGVAGYRTAPHTDRVETGERAARLLLAALEEDIELTVGWRRLPMLLAGERSETEAEPMRTLIDRLRAADERDGIREANYFLGFPWADSPYAGCHALVTGDAARVDEVEDVTTELATAFWDHRTDFDFTTEAHDPTTALDEAADTDDRPVVVAETGDIPGAGASEDVTNFLTEILDHNDFDDPVFAVFADEDACRACEAAGEGSPVDLSLGRSIPDGEPVEVTGTVGRCVTIDGTTAASVEIGGIEVLVADERTNLHRDPDNFERFGIEPAERDLVVLKSGYLSPAWKAVAARRLFALTPGDTNQVLADLPYERVPRPIAPIDEDARWSP